MAFSATTLPSLEDLTIPFLPIKNGKAPVRPMNSFMIFRLWQAKLMKQDAAEKTNQRGFSGLVSIMWNNAPTYIKMHFQTLAKLHQEWHRTAYPGYRYKPGARRQELKEVVNKSQKRKGRQKRGDESENISPPSSFSPARIPEAGPSRVVDPYIHRWNGGIIGHNVDPNLHQWNGGILGHDADTEYRAPYLHQLNSGIENNVEIEYPLEPSYSHFDFNWPDQYKLPLTQLNVGAPSEAPLEYPIMCNVGSYGDQPQLQAFDQWTGHYSVSEEYDEAGIPYPNF